jgi:hypothetical protein
MKLFYADCYKCGMLLAATVLQSQTRYASQEATYKVVRPYLSSRVTELSNAATNVETS